MYSVVSVNPCGGHRKLLGHFLSYTYLVNTKTSTPLMIVRITGDSFMLHVCIVLVKIALPQQFR